MALALLLHGQKSLFGFENGHMKQKSLHKVYINSAKFWGIKIEIYLTTEVPMGINIDQPDVQRNRYQMTPSTGTVLKYGSDTFWLYDGKRIAALPRLRMS